MLLSNQLASESLSPEPLLAAFENYRGTIHDLDRNVTVARNSLAAAVDVISAALERQGLQAGRRGVLAVSNGPLFIATLFAVLQRGGTPLLLFAETPAKELVRVARRHAADFLVTDVCPEDQLQNVATSVDWVSSDLSWLQLAISNVASGTSRDAALYPRLPGVPLHPTSGTTGTPKLAVRPAVRAVAEADNYIEALQIDSSDLVLCTVPMSHAYGYGLGTMVPLVSGASLLTTRRFHPKLLGKALREHPVTTLPLVPAMLDLLMQAAPDSLRNGPRRVTSAGAPLPERTAQRVKELTGTIVRPLYGTTETGVISVAGEDQELSGPCVGPPMSRVSARLEPVPGAAELTAGVGRLFIRSSSRMTGYVDLGGLDSSMLQDGWFETGDLARIDENGLIHLCGREKEVINVFGMKVLPGEVEEVLEMLPEVADCKVYPGRHHSGSQIVKAAVAAAGLDVAAVRAHCEQHLATYKRPEVIHMLDALPRSPMGKILRDQLP